MGFFIVCFFLYIHVPLNCFLYCKNKIKNRTGNKRGKEEIEEKIEEFRKKESVIKGKYSQMEDHRRTGV